jgi:hypothetical protein
MRRCLDRSITPRSAGCDRVPAAGQTQEIARSPRAEAAWHSGCFKRIVARIRTSNLVPAAVLCLSSLFSCGGEGGHPPPIGDAGAGHPTPVIVEFGGTSNAGSSGATSAPPGPSGGSQAFAGSSAGPGDFANGAASVGGSATLGGTSGDTSNGGTFDFGGNDSIGGTFSSAGSFSSGGL